MYTIPKHSPSNVPGINRRYNEAAQQYAEYIRVLRSVKVILDISIGLLCFPETISFLGYLHRVGVLYFPPTQVIMLLGGLHESHQLLVQLRFRVNRLYVSLKTAELLGSVGIGSDPHLY